MEISVNRNPLKDIFEQIRTKMRISDDMMKSTVRGFCDRENGDARNTKTFYPSNLWDAQLSKERLSITVLLRGFWILRFTDLVFTLQARERRTRKLVSVSTHLKFVEEQKRFVVEPYIGKPDIETNVFKTLANEILRLRNITSVNFKAMIKRFVSLEAQNGIQYTAGNLTGQLGRSEYTFYIFLVFLRVADMNSVEIKVTAKHASGNILEALTSIMGNMAEEQQCEEETPEENFED